MCIYGWAIIKIGVARERVHAANTHKYNHTRDIISCPADNVKAALARSTYLCN